ncbi:MAG: TonB-dependent receptor [Candidatus Didemnitutus sp.]|nr:TonB-dependent receptor [Candidatus Didemnitutus sp.]
MRPLILSFLLLAIAPGLLAIESAGGRIQGVVRNQATGALLRDATVEIPALRMLVLTDELGRFTLRDVPLGEHEVVASYMGLDSLRRAVNLTTGSAEASIEFPLTAEVYEMAAFQVTGEREGTAAAITRQRNADHVKTVVSLDAVGYLPNENPSDLLIRLPGITGNTDDEGNAVTVNVRGVDPGLNVVTYDGAQMATSFGLTNRNFRFLNINASAFEELEVIKAPTPDLPASSLGGTINMRTKTTLNMKQDRLVTYRLGAKVTPSFYDYSPRRTSHPYGPLAALGYKEVFSVGSGRRNLGVALDLFHSSTISNVAKTQLDYASTLGNAYIYNHQTQDGVNTRFQDSATLRFDYKHSDTSRFFFSAMYSQARDWVEPGMEDMRTSYTATNSAANFAAGYSDAYSRATSGTMDIFQGYLGFLDRQSRAQFGGEHTFAHWQLNYDLAYSNSSVELDGGSDQPYAGNYFIAKLYGVSAIIDRTSDPDFPVFTQVPTTAAKNLYNVENYRTNSFLRHREGTRDGTNYEAKLTAKTEISVLGQPLQLSSGASWLRKRLAETAHNFEWKYAGTSLASFVDPAVLIDPRFGSSITTLPRFHLGTISRDLRENPARWTDNVYYRLYEERAGTRDIEEDVWSTHLMGRMRWGKLGLLAGVRYERTKTVGDAWVRPEALTTITDPYARIAAEFGPAQRRLTSAYGDFFPGTHFTYAFRKNLIARASWSSSIGRPEPRQLIPITTVNHATQVVTVSNPDLQPQYADNFDLALEYYLKPVGLISVGLFRKEISDFIYTATGERIGGGADNGFNGDYEGYTLNFQGNGGGATIDGIELSYEQALNFLPAPLDGLTVNLNYTLLSTRGDYGSTSAPRTTDDVQGFIPSSANARLRYRYGRFSGSVAANFTDASLLAYSTDASRLQYRKQRTSIDVGAAWRFSGAVEFFVTASNITNEPYVNYRGLEQRTQLTIYNGPNVNLGISGRF